MKVDVNKFLKPCSCGRKHEIIVDDIIIESGAVSRLPEILARDAYKNFQNIVMICDENTYEAAGKTVERLVPGLKKAVLDPENLHANEHGVEAAQKYLDQMGELDLMIAVGSGTIHDISRYHAYEKKIPFFSVPTAASVDGFVSTVAAMTWHGFKKSFTAVSPIVVIADTDIFSRAPMRLTASGAADLLGKYTALADWKITHLLNGESICSRICSMEYEALDNLKKSLEGLIRGEIAAYEELMYGLLLSGLAMQMTGNSRPASGSEHHMAHFWEMAVINEEISAYHGEKVGVGLVLASDIYHKAADYLRQGKFEIKESVDVETDLIERIFTNKELCENIKKTNDPNLLDTIDPAVLKQKTKEITAIIEEIPKPEEIEEMLRKVNGTAGLQDLGFDLSMREKTAKIAPYIRDRITFLRILKFYDFYDKVIR